MLLLGMRNKLLCTQTKGIVSQVGFLGKQSLRTKVAYRMFTGNYSWQIYLQESEGGSTGQRGETDPQYTWYNSISQSDRKQWSWICPSVLSSVETHELELGIHAVRASPRKKHSCNPLTVIISSIWDPSTSGESLNGAPQYPLQVHFGIF